MRQLISALIITLFYSSTLLAGEPSVQDRVQQKLEALLQQPDAAEQQVTRTVTLLASPQQLAGLCDDPELSLMGTDTRMTGKRTALARCGAKRHFLPFRITAQGTWWMATRTLQSGSVIRKDDITTVSGHLDHQPAGLIFSSEDITGWQLLRGIPAGHPILQNQLRRPWRLRAGETVEMVISGPGFRIRSQGRALSNALENGNIFVQTRGNQKVSGKVNAEGQVVIFLQQ